MSFSVHMLGSIVPESYSRQLDERVAELEMPYGYEMPPPPADTGDYDLSKLESNKDYSPRRGRK